MLIKGKTERQVLYWVPCACVDGAPRDEISLFLILGVVIDPNNNDNNNNEE
jgi:hypothetical protein